MNIPDRPSVFAAKYVCTVVAVQIIFILFVAYVLYAMFAVTSGLEALKIIEPPESQEEHVLKTLPEYDDGEKWVDGDWMDFTAYGEYKYSDIDGYFESENNTLFKPVDEEMLAHFENRFYPYYQYWVDCTKESIFDDLTKVYRFSTDCMDCGDWYYYEGEYDSQTYYYFDIQTQTLYLMHYNT